MTLFSFSFVFSLSLLLVGLVWLVQLQSQCASNLSTSTNCQPDRNSHRTHKQINIRFWCCLNSFAASWIPLGFAFALELGPFLPPFAFADWIVGGRVTRLLTCASRQKQPSQDQFARPHPSLVQVKLYIFDQKSGASPGPWLEAIHLKSQSSWSSGV